jgi:hypothetical protein
VAALGRSGTVGVPASGSGHRRRCWGAAVKRRIHRGMVDAPPSGAGVATSPSGARVMRTADGGG